MDLEWTRWRGAHGWPRRVLRATASWRAYADSEGGLARAVGEEGEERRVWGGECAGGRPGAGRPLGVASLRFHYGQMGKHGHAVSVVQMGTVPPQPGSAACSWMLPPLGLLSPPSTPPWQKPRDGMQMLNVSLVPGSPLSQTSMITSETSTPSTVAGE